MEIKPVMDPAAIAALEVPLPPERPRIVEERMLLSASAEKTRRSTERLSAQFERAVDDWVRRIENIQRLSESIPQSDRMDAEDEAALDELIEDMESLAALRAQRRARFSKRINRDAKHHFKIDPSLGAIIRSFGSRLLAGDDRMIEALLEHALFLRAFRAERSSEPRNEAVYAEAKDLERHLTSIIDA